MNFCCNVDLNEKKLLEIFNGRVCDCGDYYFIPKFIKFQYPKGLNSEKPAIVSVRNELLDKGLINSSFEIIKERLNNDCKIIKDKDKDIDKDKDSEKKIEFEKFWNLYDKKVDRKATFKKWQKLTAEDKEKIMKYIPKYKIAKPDKQFRKDPSTFINKESWNDELIYDISNGTTKTQSETIPILNA